MHCESFAKVTRCSINSGMRKSYVSPGFRETGLVVFSPSFDGRSLRPRTARASSQDRLDQSR